MANDTDLLAAEAASDETRDMSLLLAPLNDALHILNRFHHRHKNQHRIVNYWWSPFGELRRHTAKLKADLEEQDKREKKEQEKAAKAKRKPKRADSKPSSSSSSPSTAPSPSVERARFLATTLVPKAYIAFTRLLTDRQFATLGLVLIGVLAQINTVIKQLLPEESPQQKEEAAEVKAEAVNVGAPVGREDVGVPVSREDVGVPISRDDIGQLVSRKDIGEPVSCETVDLDSQPKKPKLGTRKRPLLDSDVDDTIEKKPKKLKKAKLRQPEDAGEAVPSQAKDTKRSKKDKKDKKRKRGGDEFDDLFSGLL